MCATDSLGLSPHIQSETLARSGTFRYLAPTFPIAAMETISSSNAGETRLLLLSITNLSYP
jgi:hypothetical protein